MLFEQTGIPGVFVVAIERREDDRGFFARVWCQREFEQQHLATRFVQANIAFTKQHGTLRGLHYQVAPYGEHKLVRCTQGAIYDVIVDLRVDSPTYRQWFGVELSARNHRMLYIPAGCAHGYQTLTDDVEVTYQVTEFYTPEAERGVRYNDPAFNIAWPVSVQLISDKDRSWPDYT